MSAKVAAVHCQRSHREYRKFIGARQDIKGGVWPQVPENRGLHTVLRINRVSTVVYAYLGAILTRPVRENIDLVFIHVDDRGKVPVRRTTVVAFDIIVDDNLPTGIDAGFAEQITTAELYFVQIGDMATNIRLEFAGDISQANAIIVEVDEHTAT